MKVVFDPAVPAHRRITRRVVIAAHANFGRAHVAAYNVEAARRQDAIACKNVEIAGPRVLQQVADLAGRGDRAGRRERLAGEHLRQRRLARAVAADQPDAIAGGNAKGDGIEQHPGADADLNVGGGDHAARPFE